MRPRLEPWRLSDVLIVVTVVAALMIVSFLGGRAFCAAVLAAFIVGPAYAGALDETRYCGEPKRNARGDIIRRADVLTAFRKAHPCPVTGLSTGPCKGWAIDHVLPLASCGCDAVANLQWLPNAIKSGAGKLPKDRWERDVYLCRVADPLDCIAEPQCEGWDVALGQT